MDADAFMAGGACRNDLQKNGFSWYCPEISLNP